MNVKPFCHLLQADFGMEFLKHGPDHGAQRLHGSCHRAEGWQPPAHQVFELTDGIRCPLQAVGFSLELKRNLTTQRIGHQEASPVIRSEVTCMVTVTAILSSTGTETS